MEIFNCRSPFIIDVNGASDQVTTKLDLKIWEIGTTEPIDVTKTRIKEKFSDTQYINYYNISPFVADLISPFNQNFAYNVKVEKYYKNDTDTDWNLIETLNYVSVYGYNDYVSQNFTYTTDLAVLRTSYTTNENINYTLDAFGSMIPNIDLIFDFTSSSSDYRLLYTELYPISTPYQYYVDYTNDGTIKKFRMPMSFNFPEFSKGNNFKVQIFDGIRYIDVYEVNLIPTCEQKYNPFLLSFVNRMGGVQQITLFKNSTQSIEVKSSDFNTNTFTAGYPTYDIILGQKRIFNKNGVKTIKCNTGWINEYENANIQDIMLSENLFIHSADSVIDCAVTLKNTSMQMKTHLNEKVINYELEFEVASKLINNVV